MKQRERFLSDHSQGCRTLPGMQLDFAEKEDGAESVSSTNSQVDEVYNILGIIPQEMMSYGKIAEDLLPEYEDYVNFEDDLVEDLRNILFATNKEQEEDHSFASVCSMHDTLAQHLQNYIQGRYNLNNCLQRCEENASKLSDPEKVTIMRMAFKSRAYHVGHEKIMRAAKEILNRIQQGYLPQKIRNFY